jgi:hypothetical protein
VNTIKGSLEILNTKLRYLTSLRNNLFQSLTLETSGKKRHAIIKETSNAR